MSQELLPALGDLGFPAQPKRMGFVATAVSSRRRPQPHAHGASVKPEGWIRNLSHDTSATRPRRHQERARAGALNGRKRRLQNLSNTVGRKVAKRQLSGPALTALHGSAVSGVATQALEQARAGWRAGGAPALQPASRLLSLRSPVRIFDLIYVTGLVVAQHARWLSRGLLDDISQPVCRLTDFPRAAMTPLHHGDAEVAGAAGPGTP